VLRTSVMVWMENGLARLDQTASDMQSTIVRTTVSGAELLRETGARLYELGIDFGTEAFTLLKTYDSPEQ
jgi:hypothetical protein